MTDWLTAFYKVILQPRPRTFSEITANVEGTFQTGLAWIFISTVIVEALAYIGGQQDLMAVVFGLIAFPIAMIIWAALINYLYRRFISQKRQFYDELFYALVCIYVPSTILNALLVFIPGAVGIVNTLIPLYQVVLVAIAIIGITKTRPVPAIIISVVSTVVALIVTVLLIFFIPALLLGVSRTY
jgi:hypothetical protein